MTFPASLTNIDMFTFMFRQDDPEGTRSTSTYLGTLTFNCPFSAFNWSYDGAAFTTEDYNAVLSYARFNQTTAPDYYTTGVKVSGTSGPALISKLGDCRGGAAPNSSNIKCWRRLVAA